MGSLGTIKKTVGDTYGSTQATKRSKKRARKSKKATEEEDAKEGYMYDSKVLLKMPFDIFAETCSHLEGTDLINLAQVNKSFRQTLLSKAARSIWIARRKSDRCPLPDGTTELELATLVYGTHCLNCGTQISFLRESLSLQLRQRACKKCRRQLQIRGQTMKATWKDLHAEAVNCVIYDSEKWWTGRTHFTYLVSDLDEVDHVLKDLQEQDENILSSIESLKYRSGTRSRNKQSSTLPVADYVSSYVESRQVLVREHEKISQELIAAAKSKETEIRKVAKDKSDKINEKFSKISLLLKRDAGWSDEEAKCFFTGHWGMALMSTFHVPEEPPSADSDAWIACRRIVAEQIVSERNAILESDRWRQLYDYYPTLVATFNSSTTVTLLPSQFDFMNLPDIVPLWKPADADTSTEVFDKARPIFEKAFKKYQHDARTLAIRSIIAVNRGIDISKLSKDPAAYSETVYDSTFFSLATSQFSSWAYGTIRKLLPFPEVLQANRSASLGHLERCIDTRQVGLIRLMLEVAGLDPSVTSWKDLVRFGERFVWINAPIRKRRNRKEIYDCFGLLEAIRRRGPSKAKLKAGHVVEIGITENESDGEESGSDDSSEDRGSSEEEEDEEDEDDA